MSKKMILADLVAPLVSESDTDRMVIREIPRAKLTEDSGNFYHIDEEDVSALAANIATVGLQQPLRVRREGEGYVIVSGHRRFRAICQLAADHDGDGWETVPCIVESAGSEALNELRMILANADTRKLSPADISRQAERVEALLYQLKEEGYEFPGRMRDHVAEACRVSKSKLARLKVIRDRLGDGWTDKWTSGELAEDTAYKLAQLPGDFQDRLAKVLRKPTAEQIGNVVAQYEAGVRWVNDRCMRCPDGTLCQHFNSFLLHDAKCYAYSRCHGSTCCLKCRNATGYGACSAACSKAKAAAAEAKKAEEAKIDANRKRERTKLQKSCIASAQRLLPALDAGNVADDEKLMGWPDLTVGDVRALAKGEGEKALDRFMYRGGDPLLPSWISGDVARKLASLTGASLDWIMGESEYMWPADVLKSGTTAGSLEWREGTPPAPGRYLVLLDMGTQGLIENKCDWTGDEWRAYGRQLDASFTVELWYPLPPEWSPLMDPRAKEAAENEV